MARRDAERQAAARRRALMQDPARRALAAAQLVDAVPDAVMNWLTGLVTLEPLPFSSIVGNAAMLPPESLRFFYLDPNWLAALFDGALAIGASTPLQLPVWQAAMHQIEQQVLTKAGYGDGPACGFLLRSGVIAAYPRLVVTGYADTDGNQPVTPVRLEVLGKGVMIGIFPSPLARLDITEPPEGVQFGFELDDSEALVINLRNIAGTDPGAETGATLAAAAYLGRDGESTRTVLDVVALQAALQQALAAQLSDGALGPADFAVQLVAAPETQRFILQLASARSR
jgi:hypothetical protein